MAGSQGGVSGVGGTAPLLQQIFWLGWQWWGCTPRACSCTLIALSDPGDSCDYVILVRAGKRAPQVTIRTVETPAQQCVPQGRPSPAAATTHIYAITLGQTQRQQMRQIQIPAMSHSLMRRGEMRSQQKQLLPLSAATD
jgi:spore germination protein YaaH